MKSAEKEELKEQIIRYYETCDTDYAWFWHLRSRLAMHYGYWDKDTGNLKDALWNMNEFLATKAEINSSDSVLDAGCGVGGSSFYLAEKRQCKVHGITLSERHAREANQLAENLQMQNKIVFSARDFCATAFPDSHFSCVWALESVCHANSKMDFVNETFRILKPGGRLVLADFFQKENLNEAEGETMQRWAESWAVPFFETAENFGEMLRCAGFENVNTENINRNIDKSSRILNRYFVPGLLSNWLMPIFGKRKSPVQKRNVWSVHLQRTSFKKGLWNYMVFTAQKPL